MTVPVLNKFYDPPISSKWNKTKNVHMQTINHIFAWKTWKTVVCEGIHSHAHYAMNAKNLESTNNLENNSNTLVLSTVNSTLPQT